MTDSQIAAAATRGSGATSGRPRVVIVGAGFAGLAAARALADLAIIDRRDHHLFQPLLYQVATAALTPAEIAAPIRGMFRDHDNARVVMDEVVGIDTEARKVISEGRARLSCDTLVLAMGARHSCFGNNQWAAHAPGLKTIYDVFHLRQRILSAVERAERTENAEDRTALPTFLIVGGGPTGVELDMALRHLTTR